MLRKACWVKIFMGLGVGLVFLLVWSYPDILKEAPPFSLSMFIPTVGNPNHAADFKYLMGAWSVDAKRSLALDKAMQAELKRNPEAGEHYLMEIHLSPTTLIMYNMGSTQLNNPATFHKISPNEFIIRVQGDLSKWMHRWRQLRFVIQPDGSALFYIGLDNTIPNVMVKGSAMAGEVSPF